MTKEQFLNNHQEKFGLVFVAPDGKCPTCKFDAVEDAINNGKDGNQPLTGCPNCHKSFCE